MFACSCSQKLAKTASTKAVESAVTPDDLKAALAMLVRPEAELEEVRLARPHGLFVVSNGSTQPSRVLHRPSSVCSR